MNARRLFSQNVRRKPRNPQKEAMMSILKLSPHAALAGLFMFTCKRHILKTAANSHLLMIPFMTGLTHWMYMNRHIQKLTLYYDLNKMSNNANLVATYG